jgi:hypothetical protein
LDSRGQTTYSYAGNGLIFEARDETVISFTNLHDREWDVQKGMGDSRRRVESASTDIKASSSSKLLFQRQVERVDLFDMEHYPISEMIEESLMAQKADDVRVKRPVDRKPLDPIGINPYIFSRNTPQQDDVDMHIFFDQAASPRDSNHASTLFTILASNGERADVLKLLDIATDSENPFTQEAKESLMFATNVDEDIARVAALKMSSIGDLSLVAYFLSQISSTSAVIDLIQPFLDKLEFLNGSELTRALLGLSNLRYLHSCELNNRANIDLVCDAIRKYQTSKIESVRLVSMQILPPSSKTLRPRSRSDNNITKWDREGEMYDSIQPLSLRRDDVYRYPVHTSLLWGKMLGTPDLNGRLLTGSFAGVDRDLCSAPNDV